ncbi:hypothetical protein CXB42_03860 [Pseudomonas syringae pv. syringae]|uniref:Uncharacterized protein n=1 Tax=Pseudomonas syringae pv. syringae TaxID=321 RepID=A0AAE5VVE3_PSESY|nr:hypothetical protein CXB42_03860 [Pseudomonas syringae pv. syringae]
MTGNADRERSNQLTCVAGFCFASDVYTTPDQRQDSAVFDVAPCVVSTVAVEKQMHWQRLRATHEVVSHQSHIYVGV